MDGDCYRVSYQEKRPESFCGARTSTSVCYRDARTVSKNAEKDFRRFKVKAISVSLLKTLWASIWVVLVCLWPFARWVATIDLSFQLIRTAYYWNNPSISAGWTFLLHFAAFTAWTYLVGVHRPAGFRDLTAAGPGEKKARPETAAIPKRLVAHH
jgi:hypothetical protein